LIDENGVGVLPAACQTNPPAEVSTSPVRGAGVGVGGAEVAISGIGVSAG
jgi:hypothetical protein